MKKIFSNITMLAALLVAGAAFTACSNVSDGILPEDFTTTRTVDLSQISAAYTAQNGDVLTGMLGTKVKISIASGATVMLSGVTINADGASSTDRYAGLVCEGDAIIILADGSKNTVKGFNGDHPGIFVPKGKTLTINGTGQLTAIGCGGGSGIGGGYNISCGNINIAGGTVTATGGNGGAGIGSGEYSSCGNITITGGTVNATGDFGAAGIGSGNHSSCGNITITGGTVNATGGMFAAGIGSGNKASFASITITSGVTSVTSRRGENSPYSIGAGDESFYLCGKVTIEEGANVTQY